MLGADARLLTEGEEIISHDLFAKLNSKKTITGEDEDEETELEFLTEIRTLRDKQPDLFERIKRLPKKARSTRILSAEPPVQEFPACSPISGRASSTSFSLAHPAANRLAELDFHDRRENLEARRHSEKPASPSRASSTICSTRTKPRSSAATTADAEQADATHRGGRNDAYILKRLKAQGDSPLPAVHGGRRSIHPASDHPPDRRGAAESLRPRKSPRH